MLDIYSKSLLLRENTLKELSLSNISYPQMIGLRFGTVVGISSRQRTDNLIPDYFESAYTTGVIQLFQPEIYIAFLWIQDLSYAISLVIKKHTSSSSFTEPFEIYNLQTVSVSTAKVATTVALITGARIEVISDTDSSSKYGFSVDSSKFENKFDFRPKGTLEGILTEYDKYMPNSIIPQVHKGYHNDQLQNGGTIRNISSENSVSCPICGSHNLQEIVNLHEQPFANECHKTSNMSNFPLRLMRCRVCNHVHVPYAVGQRNHFHHNYLYQDGESSTVLKHFEWLADKVEREVDELGSFHSILEISCNDGILLDKFKAKGWKTYGVEHASNIVSIARAKGHNVIEGYWGSKDIPLDSSFSFTTEQGLGAIIAQNVLAHVTNPVEFLKACERIMDESTKLYIQTSQCRMLEEGQPASYHGHVSFFSGVSFQRAASLSGLQIISFELIPVHGTSCLVTFMKLNTSSTTSNHDHNNLEISPTLSARLQYETKRGYDGDFFYMKYHQKALKVTKWIAKSIKSLRKHDYNIVVYGLAAKGIALFDFLTKKALIGKDDKFDFIVDDCDAEQDQNSPVTSIPIVLSDRLSLLNLNENKYGIIILAWDIWDEIARNILLKLQGQQGEIICLIPFPTQRMVSLNLVSGSITEISTMPYYPSEIPNIIQMPRRKLMLITSFYNEELLLPYFILHHAHMFDHAILIDYQSNDKSIEIINNLAPPSWRVVASSTGTLYTAGNPGNDGDMMFYESMYPNDWKITLTITEFLIHPNLKRDLYRLDAQLGLVRHCLIFPAVIIVGNETVALKKYVSLPLQRSAYALVGENNDIQNRQYMFPPGYVPFNTKEFMYSRFMHVGFHVNEYFYTSGRHAMSFPTEIADSIKIYEVQGGFIMKYLLSPWPESIPRKVQIRKNIPKSKLYEITQHTVCESKENAEQLRNALLEGKTIYDLKNVLTSTAAGSSSMAFDDGHFEYHQTYHHALEPDHD